MDVDGETTMTPMPSTQGIQSLRDKLHARMDKLRGNRGAATGEAEPGSKDELLEERRRQRGLMRDRRRKETKEKIKRQEESKNPANKGKEKEKQHDRKGNQTKVRSFSSFHRSVLNFVHRHNCWYQKNPLVLGSQTSRSPPLLVPVLLLEKQRTSLLRRIQLRLWSSWPLERKSWQRYQTTNEKLSKNGRNGKRRKLGWRV